MIKEDFFRMFNGNNGVVFDDQLYLFVKDMILPNRKDIPLLYRYSPANYYNIRGLETQTLFLSTNGTMNDIFEGLACEVDDKVLGALDRYSDAAYLKSFSEKKDSLLMWAHYAKNYSGMCVEYDFSKLTEEILYHLFPVYYSKRRFTKQSLNYIMDDLRILKREQEENSYYDEKDWLKDIMYLFLVKPECWAYEKEWRIIGTFPQVMSCAEDMDDEEKENFYKMPQKFSIKGCIKAVYLGAKMESSIKDHIAEICKEKLSGVMVYSAKLSKDKYELEYELYEG